MLGLFVTFIGNESNFGHGIGHLKKNENNDTMAITPLTFSVLRVAPIGDEFLSLRL